MIDNINQIGNYGVNKVFVWANADLDGVASTILLGNIFSNFEYKSIFFGNFVAAYEAWAQTDLDDYHTVFIVGMPLDQSTINRLDDSRLIFVTDKKEKLNVFDSTLFMEEKTSCCKLLYSKFKEKVVFPANLIKFIAYVDDYNSQTLKFDESKYLNAIYRKSGTHKFTKFVNRFWNGFDGLTDKEVNLGDQFYRELEKELETLTLYQGEFKGFKVMSTFTKFSVNEISQALLDVYGGEVVMIVNPDTKFVSFRKSKGSKADIRFMAENLCNGGGGEFASGGTITQKFMDFTTKLSQL